MFQRQRQVRMQVDINHVSTAESGPEALYAITFTLLSGICMIRKLLQALSGTVTPVRVTIRPQ